MMRIAKELPNLNVERFRNISSLSHRYTSDEEQEKQLSRIERGETPSVRELQEVKRQLNQAKADNERLKAQNERLAEQALATAEPKAIEKEVIKEVIQMITRQLNSLTTRFFRQKQRLATTI